MSHPHSGLAGCFLRVEDISQNCSAGLWNGKWKGDNFVESFNLKIELF